MSLGTVLREARENKGLTVEEVAERTRLIKVIIEDLEKDDFHRIVATVYGCGFIKLFAECVGVDPVPLQKEFKEVYSGFRRPAASAHAAAAVPERTDAKAPTKAQEPAGVSPVSIDEAGQTVREPPKAPQPVKAVARAASSAVSAFFASRKKELAADIEEKAAAAKKEARIIEPAPSAVEEPVAEPEPENDVDLSVLLGTSNAI